jgi:aminocarboxymuconate-semialdehyde decarboxylase
MDENCVMLGSDSPFPLGEEKPGELILKTYPNDIDKCEKLLSANARRFFKI